MLMLVLGFAPVIGPPLGAVILDEFGWRGIFWFHTVLGLAALLAVVLGLPETLPPKRRARGGILAALARYLALVRDRRFFAPTIAADGVFAGLFAFLAAGPFVLVNVYGLTAQQFALVFSLNAFGFITGTQVNARLVRQYGPAHMLRAALIVYFIGAFLLLGAVLTGFGGLIGIVVPLFILFATIGAAPTNALALAQEHYPHMAGSATALFGSIQFGIGALIGVLAGFAHDGTALPMAAIIVAAATVSLILNFALAPR
jgi:DHA1 family bicyclomycin/chloramphenicol resistance-like MFS transporter